MRLIDISPPVRAETPVWPGDQAFTLEPKWSIDAGDSVTVGTVTTTTHIGAHIDAPAHIIASAPSVYEISLEACIGECLVVDISDLVDRTQSPHAPPAAESVITRVQGFCNEPIERLLLRHHHTSAQAWNDDMPGVDAQLMRWFGAQGGKLMGIDLASYDPAQSKTLDCHREAIERGVVMLEGVDLSDAPEGFCELIALPMPWVGADASPVRAVLRVR